VPEIRLHLADEAHDLWLKTEDELDEIGLPPPFWAFAWAGGQGLARHILDNPELVAGKQRARFRHRIGAGGNCRKDCPARRRCCRRHRPLGKATATRLNADANGVELRHRQSDLIGADRGWDVVLAGDVFYDRDLAERLSALV
jgi:predicted nicotinamide N-methyase